MADTPANNVNFMALMNPDFAAKQLAFQQQQQLAQQMMQEGSQQPDTAQLANPGGLVVPSSPWAAAARAGERMLGAYMQKQNNDELLNSYKDLAANNQYQANPLSSATNAAIGNGEGPATADSVNKQLAAQMMQGQVGGGSKMASVMMNDPAFIQNAMVSGVDNATKVWLAQNSPTDLAKNAANPVTAPYLAKDQLINVNGHFMPAADLVNNKPVPPQVSNTQAPQPAPSPNPPTVDDAAFNALFSPQPTDVQAAADNKYGVPKAPDNSQPNVAPSPQGGEVKLTKDPIDYNNPVEVEARKKEATDTAANTAKREESYTKAQSSLVSMEQEQKNLLEKINTAQNLINGGNATGWHSYLADVPNSDAGALRDTLDTIKTNIGFKKLQSMRENSPTGGALGQVSDMENKMLQAIDGALNPKQENLLSTNLQTIKELYPQVLAEKKRAFQQDYGAFKPLGNNPQPVPPTPSASTSERVSVITPDGKRGTIDKVHLQELLDAGGKLSQ